MPDRDLGTAASRSLQLEAAIESLMGNILKFSGRSAFTDELDMKPEDAAPGGDS